MYRLAITTDRARSGSWWTVPTPLQSPQLRRTGLTDDW